MITTVREFIEAEWEVVMDYEPEIPSQPYGPVEMCHPGSAGCCDLVEARLVGQPTWLPAFSRQRLVHMLGAGRVAEIEEQAREDIEIGLKDRADAARGEGR
jgi:hypothetical protein